MTNLESAPELSCDLTARRILLSGKIDEIKSQDFREAILDLSAENPSKPITVYIDTYGGSSYSMFAMYDAMMLSPCEIHTVGIGKVMSGGVLLLAAGTKRFITQNTIVMMHQVSTEMQGEVNQLKIELAHVKSLQERMYSLYSSITGVSKEVIEQDLTNDKYMTAEEAVKYGLADIILGKEAAE